MRYQYPFREPWSVTLPYGVKGAAWKAGFHSGLDLVSRAAGGDGAVRPVAPGTVIRAQTGHASYGNYVTLRHPDGMLSLYAHLDTLAVRAGDAVDYDSRLGTEGATGNVTGRHLHLELHRGEYLYPSPVDPEAFLEEMAQTEVEEADAYAREAVDWALAQGILRGDGGSIRLKDPITRQDAVVLLHRLSRLDEG
ncbi:MAG: peptidoglycan DD-metalloendopeptidase family protein [Clostridia bacterium]|nr:peptidoglycan DD-metalloendopeptidase family protein [Clostridia bacterium]